LFSIKKHLRRVKFKRAVLQAQKDVSRSLDDNIARKLSRLELSSVSPSRASRCSRDNEVSSWRERRG